MPAIAAEAGYGVDLYRLGENDRINLIGRSVMAAPGSSADKPPMNAFVVETEEKRPATSQNCKSVSPASA